MEIALNATPVAGGTARLRPPAALCELCPGRQRDLGRLDGDLGGLDREGGGGHARHGLLGSEGLCAGHPAGVRVEVFGLLALETPGLDAGAALGRRYPLGPKLARALAQKPANTVELLFERFRFGAGERLVFG